MQEPNLCSPDKSAMREFSNLGDFMSNACAKQGPDHFYEEGKLQNMCKSKMLLFFTRRCLEHLFESGNHPSEENLGKFPKAVWGYYQLPSVALHSRPILTAQISNIFVTWGKSWLPADSSLPGQPNLFVGNSPDRETIIPPIHKLSSTKQHLLISTGEVLCPAKCDKPSYVYSIRRSYLGSCYLTDNFPPLGPPVTK